MNDWKKTTDHAHRNQWICGDYSIVEMKRPIDEKEYFIYCKNNFITVRLTTEQAKEYCESRMGKL